jgi:succinate dehydrogenase/fumarate reductase flavoprotein subunit
MTVQIPGLPEPCKLSAAGLTLPVYSFNTVVVGTGCAGYNAADALFSLGQEDVAIVTEGVNMGTSRNTGSDKQTYYKLTLSGGEPDSIHDMAETLFSGGSMHGDIALIEAAMSARGFYKLVNLGVPFPHNEYGEYVGYKTDHDPRQRATSCGPLTSRLMTEHLQRSVEQKGIPVFDGFRVVAVITDGEPRRAVGLVAVDRSRYDDENFGLTVFSCTNVIYATGGPSGIYFSSVYPESQTCATGTALEAGVAGVNLTESQYGIASTKFRWNLSGTYQQVIPTYISTDRDGGDEREFLDDYFATPGEMMNAVFLKGYQWPFDPRKLHRGGSSIVDIAVFKETREKGRRVFLDFRVNPSRGGDKKGLRLEMLNDVTREYLEKSGALLDTPINRLLKMNPLAFKLYLDNGIDLKAERLEIDVCAQHNNGGLSAGCWWESGLKRFFPVGEVNGTFGVYRPGGSALNSTQTGSARAAQLIAARYREAPLDQGSLAGAAEPVLGKILALARSFRENALQGKGSAPMTLREGYQRRMDGCGAMIRPSGPVKEALRECRRDLESIASCTAARGAGEMTDAFINRDILITQISFLSAIDEYIGKGGLSRGSYLVCGAEGPDASGCAEKGIPADLDDGAFSDRVCEVAFDPETMECAFVWKTVRPIPSGYDDWFENVYNAYSRGEIIAP